MVTKAVLLALAALTAGCSDTVSQNDGGDAAADVEPDYKGYCPQDWCGQTTFLPPDGAPTTVDSCGDTCTCTVDQFGVAMVDCAESCPCSDP